MSHTLDESTPPTEFPDVFSVADDGDVDAMTAPGSPSSIVTDEEMFAVGAQRTRWLLNALQGLRVGSFHARTRASDHTITLSVGQLVVGRKFTPPTTATDSVLAVPTTPEMIADEGWLYLYGLAHATTGVLVLERSTVAPDATLRFKSGDASRRYLCALKWYADSTNKVCEAVTANGRTHYLRDGGAQDAALDLDVGGLSTGNHRLAVPPTARFAFVRLVFTATGTPGGATQVILLPAGGSGDACLSVLLPAAALPTDTRLEFTATVPVGADGNVYVSKSIASNVTATLITDGWEE